MIELPMGSHQYLGVDQSLRNTGIGVVDQTGALIEATSILPGKRRDSVRLQYIWLELLKLLDKTQPSMAAIEGYSYNSTGRVFELGEVGGIVKLALTEMKVPFIVVPPVLLKKFATNKNMAQKHDMIFAAAKLCDLKITDHNQADAFFLAQIAKTYNAVEGLPRHQVEVINVLRIPSIKKSVPRKKFKPIV